MTQSIEGPSQHKIEVSQKSPISDQHHYTDLDGMRGVLAVVVMLHHYGLNVILNRVTLGMIGVADWNLSVDFFFILSGFVLCRSFTSRKVSLRFYFQSRLFRLFPMYLITLLVSILMEFPTNHQLIVENLAMIQSFLNDKSINGPSWSIPFELFIPLIILLLVDYIKNIKVVWFLIIAMAIVASIFALERVHKGNFQSVFRPMASILGGALLYLVFRSKPPKALPFITMVGFGGAIAMMVLTARSPLAYFAFFGACGVAIYWGSRTRTVLSSKPIQCIGRWSYSIYLIHSPIEQFSLLHLGEDAVRSNVFVKAIWVFTTIFLAAFSYEMIEKPMIELGKWSLRMRTRRS